MLWTTIGSFEEACLARGTVYAVNGGRLYRAAGSSFEELKLPISSKLASIKSSRGGLTLIFEKGKGYYASQYRLSDEALFPPALLSGRPMAIAHVGPSTAYLTSTEAQLQTCYLSLDSFKLPKEVKLVDGVDTLVASMDGGLLWLVPEPSALISIVELETKSWNVEGVKETLATVGSYDKWQALSLIAEGLTRAFNPLGWQDPS